ncbi:hypothetical protein LEP1GSC103_4037 [Leptospira borgpetersenii serovar Javanica str. UI 09931]|uniref:Uncharacterized protein n=1 Tax=Leptospira borgpetersenii serovar Javanica str. UI 09931 TaxID=1049767 RepID=A0AAV3J9B9_LEPBO|nr:hypothetical protein LEP1GSC101_1354 [Leptospira borgpetersenii str. UI 09149]EPG56667.1 hypothetical protein LEP1GSC103_4037 [Leptospira borgpetersenii serovar Javanica str. UI 09931]
MLSFFFSREFRTMATGLFFGSGKVSFTLSQSGFSGASWRK